MMLLLEVEEETRKKQELRNVFSLIEMTLVNGIRKIKDQSSGIYTMEKKQWVNPFEFFQSLIGQRWMFGNTLKKEEIELPSIYFSHKRSVVDRKGVLIAESPYNTLLEGEKYEERTIRYRTLGCMTITGAIESDADDLDKVIQEVASARQTERGNRADDKVSEAAMEERKKQGYFNLIIGTVFHQ